MPQKYHDRGFQDLIQQIVLRKLIKLTGQTLLLFYFVFNCARHINFAAHYRQVCFPVHIFPVESLLELPPDSFGENRREQIMHVLKFLRGDFIVVRLLQSGEGVREHVINILDEYALILCH